MGKPLNSPAFFVLSYSPPAFQSFLNTSFYLVFSSFWSLIPFSHPNRPVSALDGLLSIKFCPLLSPFWIGSTNPGQALGLFSLLSTSPKLDFVWHPAFFHKLISAGLPPCFARWTKFFLSVGVIAWFIKITKVAPSDSVEVFLKDSFLGLYFSQVLLMISLLLCLLPSAGLFMLTIMAILPSSSSSIPTAVEATQGALIPLERWSEYWCFPFNPSKCETSFFSVDPH